MVTIESKMLMNQSFSIMNIFNTLLLNYSLLAKHYRLHKHELQAPQSTDAPSLLHRYRHD